MLVYEQPAVVCRRADQYLVEAADVAITLERLTRIHGLSALRRNAGAECGSGRIVSIPTRAWSTSSFSRRYRRFPARSPGESRRDARPLPPFVRDQYHYGRPAAKALNVTGAVGACDVSPNALALWPEARANKLS